MKMVVKNVLGVLRVLHGRKWEVDG
jgi:hypothetical protein